MEQRKNIFLNLAATFFGVGYFPLGSGTAATAAGLVVVYGLSHQPVVYLLVLFTLTLIGVIAAGHVERTSGEKDPGIVVIDEVVGIMIALLGIPLSWKTALCGFFLFRALDMFKIYPINKFEAIPGGVGIMLDDVMAGLYTNIILSIAVHWAGLV